MTICARGGRGLVKQNISSIHRLLKSVTGGTSHILMSTLKWKDSLIVIEQRRPPFVGIVTRCAVIGARAKLIGVRVFVALAARHGGFFELNVHQGQLHVRRLVAVGAGNGAMRTYQGKPRARMIELDDVVPALGRMADLATKRFACAVALCHALGKLALVDVFMTGGATEFVEVIEGNCRTCEWLMAVVAGNRHVAAGQWET